jgi:propanol-preferring alcohol dehydrogenase
MRALELESPAPVTTRPLRAVDRPDPVPGRGEVVVRVSACGICRTDLHVIEGELPVRRRPVIPGHQIVGTVVALGEGVPAERLGARVGVAWLHRACGTCRFCRGGRENLCQAPAFTGWTVDGGFAERVVADDAFVYALPEGFGDLEAAPLLCAGIIGYRCLEHTGIASWAGARLGLYGFGAAAHVAIQTARARGADVYVCPRERARHEALARELGATWTGGAIDTPPVRLDAGIVFAPAGEIVPVALSHLDDGGTLVLGGIHMSDLPAMPYERIYRERVVRSVANNTRDDGRRFLAEAARVRVRTHVETFPLEAANEAMLRLATDAIRGAGVLVNPSG